MNKPYEQYLLDIEIMPKCGIYIICNSIDDNFYIGGTSNLQTRYNYHINKLRKGNHFNKNFQELFNKHGEVFSFGVICICTREELLQKEQYYLDILKPTLNVAKHAVNSQAYNLTEETKQKQSKSKKGQKNPQSKLTVEQVEYIRATKGIISGVELANKYGVSTATISDVRNYKLYN